METNNTAYRHGRRNPVALSGPPSPETMTHPTDELEALRNRIAVLENAERRTLALVALHGMLSHGAEPEDVKHNAIVAVRSANALIEALNDAPTAMLKSSNHYE